MTQAYVDINSAQTLTPRDLHIDTVIVGMVLLPFVVDYFFSNLQQVMDRRHCS